MTRTFRSSFQMPRRVHALVEHADVLQGLAAVAEEDAEEDQVPAFGAAAEPGLLGPDRACSPSVP